MFCNIAVPQLLWSRRLRRTPVFLWVASLFMNVGMWAERYMIIVRGLERDHLPAAWGDYSPTWVDLGILTGTLGLFFFLFLSFVRLFPFVPIAETKAKQEEAA
jgi:molybdopterin-containing oxidoreductase family membrane subunit